MSDFIYIYMDGPIVNMVIYECITLVSYMPMRWKFVLHIPSKTNANNRHSRNNRGLDITHMNDIPSQRWIHIYHIFVCVWVCLFVIVVGIAFICTQIRGAVPGIVTKNTRGLLSVRKHYAHNFNYLCAFSIVVTIISASYICASTVKT